MIFLFLVGATSSYATARHYLLNSERSHILLNWQMIGKSTYHARISGLQGSLIFNPQRDTDNQIQVTIPIANLDAHHAVLTWALKSHQFFNQAKYPNALFISSRIVDQGAGRYRIFGSLQIRDQRRPVILYARISPDSRPIGIDSYLQLSGHITVSRAGFGMGQYPALVADPINVDISLIVGER